MTNLLLFLCAVLLMLSITYTQDPVDDLLTATPYDRCMYAYEGTENVKL